MTTATVTSIAPEADEKAEETRRWVEGIRERVKVTIEAEGLSQVEVAKLSGIPYGTFTGWLSGKYQGRQDRVARDIECWLVAREENRRAAGIVPEVPDWFDTESARAFTEALRFAQIMPEISVIAGGAGIGKTTTARRYARTNSNVWMATMNPSCSGVHAMLTELAEALGVVEKSPGKLPKAIGLKVRDTRGLIIIDEAQHLQPVALDMLRSIYDRWQVGIALVGNETVYARLEGEGRKASFAQLYSRIGVRVTQALPRGADIDALIAAWGVSDAEETRFLKAVAKKPGALRGATKCLQMASMFAAGGGEVRGLKHMKAAWSRLTVSGETA